MNFERTFNIWCKSKTMTIRIHWSGRDTLFAYTFNVDEQTYESWHGTVSSLPSGRSISKRTEGRGEVTRFRSGEKIKEEAGREWERREALFCLGEETRPERRARKLSSVCLLETYALLTPRVLRPATLSYIFVVRAPFLFAPAPTKYEGRFAGVLRVKTRYRIGGASATAVTSPLYGFRIIPSPCPRLRRRAVARKDVSDTCRKFPCILASVCEILLTWRSSLEYTFKQSKKQAKKEGRNWKLLKLN